MDDRPQLDSSEDNSPADPESASGDARRGELRAAIERGLEDIRAGRVADLEQALGRIEGMLDELEAGKSA